jgi:glutamyl-Q tRNA(Asp) synthetase
MTMIVTRFAPSPTGRLHLGHAFAASFAFQAALAAKGRFLLRIEDIDQTRCRPEFEQGILEDLAWLGLVWDGPVRRQSDHFALYKEALDRLDAMGLLYPCFCTRKEIEAEIARSGQAPHGPEGAPYPGLCRSLSGEERQKRSKSGQNFALRLDMKAALSRTGPLTWQDKELGRIEADPLTFGDIVLARKDTPASYHLACALDDHLQGVSLVTRGADLIQATHVQRVLQSLLGLNEPLYHHHPLLAGPDGRRFAKRDAAMTLKSLCESGISGQDALAMAEACPRIFTPPGS